METDGIGATSPPGQPTYELPKLKQDFLKILVHQMKGQNPFSAADSDAFLTQMAQFSSLEQIQNLNQSIAALIALQSQNAAIQDLTAGSALIGFEVVYDAEDGPRSGIVESVSVGSQGTMLKVNGEPVPLLAITEVLGKPASDGGSGDDEGDSS